MRISDWSSDLCSSDLGVVAHAARSRGVDGVVCGHIHSAEMREIDGTEYYNDGDWVEGCTALVEHHDGRMKSSTGPWRSRRGAPRPSSLCRPPHEDIDRHRRVGDRKSTRLNSSH